MSANPRPGQPRGALATATALASTVHRHPLASFSSTSSSSPSASSPSSSRQLASILSPTTASTAAMTAGTSYHPFYPPAASISATDHGLEGEGPGDDEFDMAFQRFAAARSDYNDPVLQPYKVKIVHIDATPPLKRERLGTVMPETRNGANVQHSNRRDPRRNGKHTDEEEGSEGLSERAKGKRRSREADQPAEAEAYQDGTAKAGGSVPYPVRNPYAYPDAPYYRNEWMDLPGDNRFYPSHLGPPSFYGPPETWPHFAQDAFDPYHPDPRYTGPWAWPYHEEMQMRRYHSESQYAYQRHLANGYRWPTDDTAYAGENGYTASPDEASFDLLGSGADPRDEEGEASNERSSEPSEHRRPRHTKSRLGSNLAKTLLSRRGEGKRRIVTKEDRSYGALLLSSRANIEVGAADRRKSAAPLSRHATAVADATAAAKARAERLRATSVAASHPSQNGMPARALSVGAAPGPVAPGTAVTGVKRKRGRPPTRPFAIAAAAARIKLEAEACAGVPLKQENAHDELEELGTTRGPLDDIYVAPKYPETQTMYVSKERKAAWIMSHLASGSSFAGMQHPDRQHQQAPRPDPTKLWTRWTWSSSLALFPCFEIKADPERPASQERGPRPRHAEYTSLLRTHHLARRKRDYVLNVSSLHRLAQKARSRTVRTAAPSPTASTTAAAPPDEHDPSRPLATGIAAKRARAREAERARKAEAKRHFRLQSQMWTLKRRRQVDAKRLWTLWVHRQQEQRRRVQDPSEDQSERGEEDTPNAKLDRRQQQKDQREGAEKAPPRARLPFLRRNLKVYRPFLEADFDPTAG